MIKERLRDSPLAMVISEGLTAPPKEFPHFLRIRQEILQQEPLQLKKTVSLYI